MDYKLTGEHMPGKIGEWRFDKRTYHDKAPPRNLEQPPANMKNDLVRGLVYGLVLLSEQASLDRPAWPGLA